MPIRRNVKKVTFRKKKAYRKKAPMYRKRFQSSQGNLFPKTFKAKLKYFDQFTLNPNAVAPASTIYSALSLFDPDVTGVGHQPMGFDQYMGIYNKYRVVGSKISVTFVAADSTSSASSALCGILKSNDLGAPLGIGNFIENDKCVYRTIQLGETAKPISIKYSTKKEAGFKNIMDISELAGSSATSPVHNDYFHVFTNGVGDTTDPAAIRVNVHITYIAVFSEPKQLSGS